MKSVMSGQNITFINRIRSALEIFYGYIKGSRGNVEYTWFLHKKLREAMKKYIKVSITEAYILDLGCGQRAEQAALFNADGAHVVGVDMEVPTYRINLEILARVIRINGIERALKSLVRHLFFDRQYFLELSSVYGKTVSFDRLDVRVADGTGLPFTDCYFDFVACAYVFEHISDVAVAIQEVNRVLKPSGIAWIGIHLFPSLSGGHHVLVRVPPWDHLREHKYPVNTYLNRLALKDYRAIFQEHVDIVEEALEYEGEDMLTAELEKVLNEKGYTRHDLLTKTVTFICRKK